MYYVTQHTYWYNDWCGDSYKQVIFIFKMPLFSISLNRVTKTNLINKTPGCWDQWQNNVGTFPDDSLLDRRELTSLHTCQEWCAARTDCKAAVVSPVYWNFRECFLVSTSTLSERYGWYTLVIAADKCSGEKDKLFLETNTPLHINYNLKLWLSKVIFRGGYSKKPRARGPEIVGLQITVHYLKLGALGRHPMMALLILSSQL